MIGLTENNAKPGFLNVFSALLNLEEMDSVSEIGGAAAATRKIMAMKNGPDGANTGSSAASAAYVRSLPPTGFSGVSTATVTTAPPGTSPFWQTPQGTSGGMFAGSTQQGQPLPPPPPPLNSSGHQMPPSGMIADMKTPDMQGYVCMSVLMLLSNIYALKRNYKHTESIRK